MSEIIDGKSLLNEPKTLEFQKLFEHIESSQNTEQITRLDIRIDPHSDLSLLSQFDNLTNLVIVMSPVSRQIPDLSPLGLCKGLESLTLCLQNYFFNHRERFESFDISWISKIEGLESFDFAVFTESVDFTPLSKCTNLRRLKIRSTLLDEIDLEPISVCSELEEMTLLWNRNATSIILPTLDNHPKMFRIYIHHRNYGNREYTSFEHRFEEIQPIDLTRISECHTLKILVLRGLMNMKSIDLTPIGKLKSLEYLNISNATPASETMDLTPLGESKSLRYLILEDVARSVLDISPLFECSLQTFTPFHPSEPPTPTDLPLMTVEQVKESYWTSSEIRLKDLYPDTLEEFGLLNSYRPLIADSNEIPIEKRNPSWLEPFRVEWY